MIILTILIVALLAFTLTAILSALAGGITIAVLFGDLIIFGLIVWGIVALCSRKK